MQKLFDQLQHLASTNDAFLRFDYTRFHEELGHSVEYVVFSYRIASYTDFLNDGALESRGIMFFNNGDEYKIVSRTPQKFFNINENPFTMDLNFDEDPIVESLIKEDGSLISTYSITGKDVYCKSKQSVNSEQAVLAGELLNADADLLSRVITAESDGYTVHLEYCAPSNRVVISYDRPQLIVIMARHKRTGEYMSHEEIVARFGKYAVESDPALSEYDNQYEYIESVKRRKNGTEGVVCRTKSGLFFKVKTDWYASLHHIKDSISSPRRLFEAVLDEGIDDVRSWFADDLILMKEIDLMEDKVKGILHDVQTSVDGFYATNKHLDRKDFAILGQQELDRHQFGLAMMKYSGKEVDYVASIRKNYKIFGVSDE